MTAKILYIILFILAGAVVLLAFEVVVQHQETKDLLGRRNRKDKPKPEQQAEENCKTCLQNFHYENLVIPELNSEIEYWKAEYKNVQICNELMQKEIAKLKEKNNVSKN